MPNPRPTCLLLVDLQIDFMPGGALAVAGGDEIVAPIRSLLASGQFTRVVATQDWHPAGHVSFASTHPGRSAFEAMNLYGHEQILWPDHCVAGTAGAGLHAGLPLERVDLILRKGSDPEVDSYSGFRNNWNAEGERPATGLHGYLDELGIVDVSVCGLARDVCVRWTAEDAAELGYRTSVLWNLCRSVDPSRDGELEHALGSRGVRIEASS